MLTGWFSIAPERPFLEDLARVLSDQWPGPIELAQAIVLVPTRRGARELAQAFVDAGGGARLLPQIRALGDLDEGEPPFEPGDLALDLPPAISPWRRRFELAGVVRSAADRFGREMSPPAVLEMADALAGFLDGLQIEDVDPRGKLEALAEADLAEHWRRSTQVLDLALDAWPRRLSELGLIDPAERQAQLLHRLAERWEENPPAQPMVAAGSTGAQPAVARLLAAIAAAPRGLVVLPGLDQHLAERAWAQIEPSHPQASLKRLLDGAGVARQAVAPFPAPQDRRGRWRARLIGEALRPAAATADWLTVIERLREEDPDIDPIAEGLIGLRVVEAGQEEEAAAVCALLLREALETPGATAALVTPDRDLARRVSAHLTRWGVGADSSAGQPLGAFPAGALALALLPLLSEPLDPIAWLGVLKHPLCRLGEAQAREDLERHGLRGPRPADLTRRLLEARRLDETRRQAALTLAGDFADRVVIARQAFAAAETSMAQAARAFAESLEALAGQSVWTGPAGGCLAAVLAGLIHESQGMGPVSAGAFAAILRRLIGEASVRQAASGHPRLQILGVLEARLIRADHVVLAGLEEGVWPRPAPTDPFLSRPMRERLGLPSPERRIGLSAHDFAQAACSPQVTLVTCRRRGGTPAVESRWLWRLRTLAAGAGAAIVPRAELNAWARALGEDGPLSPAPRPRPTPPPALRPARLPVTRIETWLRDPYAIYAQYVLGLRILDPPDLAIGPRHRGTAVHKAMERFALDHGGALPAEAERLIALALEEALTEAGLPAARMARERLLAQRTAAWLVEFEGGRRDGGVRLLVEQEGVLTFAAGGRSFTLTAKADRLELRDGRLDILDFKTGAPPSQKQVDEHISSQLTLTAALAMAGGFAAVGQVEIGQLAYVRLRGTGAAGEFAPRAQGEAAAALAADALGKLKRRAAAFWSEAAPYLSRVMPMKTGEVGDYDHLARVREWSAAGGEGEGE